jgi:hypothetical protein
VGKEVVLFWRIEGGSLPRLTIKKDDVGSKKWCKSVIMEQN